MIQEQQHWLPLVSTDLRTVPIHSIRYCLLWFRNKISSENMVISGGVNKSRTFRHKPLLYKRRRHVVIDDFACQGFVCKWKNWNSIRVSRKYRRDWFNKNSNHRKLLNSTDRKPAFDNHLFDIWRFGITHSAFRNAQKNIWKDEFKLRLFFLCLERWGGWKLKM